MVNIAIETGAFFFSDFPHCFVFILNSGRKKKDLHKCTEMARRHALKEELTRLLEGSFPKSPHLSDICPVMEAPQAHACPCVDKRTKCDWGWQGGGFSSEDLQCEGRMQE